jgi:hypothetical protein
MHFSCETLEIAAFTCWPPKGRDATRTLTRSRIVSILTFGLLASLAACSNAKAAKPSCELYPISWQPAHGAQAAAQAELATLSPGAKMTWNGNTGTLRSVSQLGIPLPGCTDGHGVSEQVLAALTAHPALFQLDLTEWSKPEHSDCKNVHDAELVSLRRHRLAGQPVSHDVFTYRVKRIDGVVQLIGVSGFYLPTLGPKVGETMAACDSLTEAAATATARKTPLEATIFSRCVRTGSITYIPRANDGFSFSSAEWIWNEDTDQVILTGQRILRVTVDPANYTPGLISSDASCPAGNGDGIVIGFDIGFDIHSRAITGIRPGLGCITC